MFNKLRLSKTIFFNNKGFSVGLTIMLILCICLVGTMAIIPISIPTVFKDFREDYNVRDAYIYYSDFVYDTNGELSTTNDPNIEAVEQQKCTYTHIKDSNDELVYGLVYTTSDATKMRFSSWEHADNNTEYPSCWVSKYYARTNNIHAGSIFEIKTPTGYKKCFLSDVIICPETCHCYRNGLEWCEATYIPFVYLNATDFDSLFNSTNLYNTSYLYFKAGVDDEQQQASLDNFIAEKNINTIESFISTESVTYKLIDRVTTAVSKTLEFIPIVILALTLLCIFLFIRQIIIRSKKTSTILRDLGYSSRQNRTIFYIYELMILLISAVVGSVLCYFSCQFFFNVFINSYSLPYIYFVFNFKTLLIYGGVIILILILAVDLNYKYIDVDSRKSIDDKKLAKAKKAQDRSERLIKKFNPKNVYVKYSITKIIRDRFRMFITSLCLACSVILTLIGVTMLFSYNADTEYTYGKYLNYDGCVTFSDNEAFKSQLDALDNIEKSELVLLQKADIECGSFNDAFKIKAIDDNSTLINLIDGDYKDQEFGDGVVIDEYLSKDAHAHVGDSIFINGVEFKINGVARECVDSSLYLSYDSLAKVLDAAGDGNEAVSCYVIKFKDASVAAETYKQIEDIPGYLYKAELAKQQEVNDGFCEAVTVVTDGILFDALIVGFIIVLNTVLLNLYLRKHEYAVLECLGTKSKNYFGMSLIEFLFLYCVSMIIGVPIGFIGADLCMYLMSTTNNIYTFIHQPAVVIVSMLITLIYVIVGIILTTVKIRRANFIQILNSRE